MVTTTKRSLGNLPGLEVSDLEGAYLVPQYRMHLFPDMAYIFPPAGQKAWEVENSDAPKNPRIRIDPHSKYQTYLNLQRMNSVNGTARDIYALVDGKRTGEDVYTALLEKHNQPYGTMRPKVFDFLKEMVVRAHIVPSSVPVESSHVTTGSEEYFHPPHVSIEVTSMCNIACVHCYGSFEQARFDAINADQLIATMEQMKQQGFSSVELTGGECTVHPEFPRILRWCCENLCMIGVLTNGVSIRDEIFEILAAHADKVMVQICINGPEKYHNEFTKSSFAYQRAMKAVERLAASGVFVRTPMNVTFDNVDLIEETFHLVRAVGSCGWTMNLIDYDYGRAQEILPEEQRVELSASIAGEFERMSDDQSQDRPQCERVARGRPSCEAQMRMVIKAIETMNRLQEQYPAFVTGAITGAVKEQMDWERSCGAGRRVVYVASNGRIGLCPMSVETGVPGFGSITSAGLGSVMKTEFAQHMSHVPAPNDEDCVGPDGAFCPHRFEHRGCILHGMMQYMKTPQTCWWGQKYDVQKLIDTGSHSLTKNPDGSWNLPELTHSGTGCGCGSTSKGPSLVQLSSDS